MCLYMVCIYREAGMLEEAQDHESETLRVIMCVTLDSVPISLVFSLPICKMEDNFFTPVTNCGQE